MIYEKALTLPTPRALYSLARRYCRGEQREQECATPSTSAAAREPDDLMLYVTLTHTLFHYGKSVAECGLV
jgi:hypothetical protein